MSWACEPENGTFGCHYFFWRTPIIQRSSGEHSGLCTVLAANHSMLTAKIPRRCGNARQRHV